MINVPGLAVFCQRQPFTAVLATSRCLSQHAPGDLGGEPHALPLCLKKHPILERLPAPIHSTQQDIEVSYPETKQLDRVGCFTGVANHMSRSRAAGKHCPMEKSHSGNTALQARNVPKRISQR